MALLLPNSAFIHVPKCGGSTVRIALRDAGFDTRKERESGRAGQAFNRRSHAKWEDFKDELEHRTPFIALRANPAEWYRSYWSHRMQPNTAWTVPQHPAEREAWGDGRKPFREWAESICEARPGFLTQLYDEYLGPPGAVQVVVLTENLTYDLPYALASVGEELQTPKAFRVGRHNKGDFLPEIPEDLNHLIHQSEKGLPERLYPNGFKADTRASNGLVI